MTKLFDAGDTSGFCAGPFQVSYLPMVPQDACTLLAKAIAADDRVPRDAMRFIALFVYRTTKGGHFALVHYRSHWPHEMGPGAPMSEAIRWNTLCGLPAGDLEGEGLPLAELIACLQGDQALNVSPYGYARDAATQRNIQHLLDIDLPKINALWHQAVAEVTAALRDQL